MEVKHLRPPLLVFGLVILAATLLVMVLQTFKREVPSVEPAIQAIQGAEFKLSSPVFTPTVAIPTVYSCKGANINPPLQIENPPGNAKEFVLVVHGPNGTDGDSVQWLVWNIPVDTTAITEHSVPVGARQGTNDSGAVGYSGPCPVANTGTHTYTFDLYALNDTLSLDQTTKKDGLISAMNGKVIARTQLVGTIQTDTKP
jgi:Raf kinase inhibitor-like YbhB/YbcL family protein